MLQVTFAVPGVLSAGFSRQSVQFLIAKLIQPLVAGRRSFARDSVGYRRTDERGDNEGVTPGGFRDEYNRSQRSFISSRDK